MITHVVLLQPRADVPSQMIDDLIQDIDSLRDEIPGFLSFEHGENLKLEPHHHGFSVGFIARFENRESLDTYQNHPEHNETGRSLIACCEGGIRGILVFDYEYASVESL